MHPVPRLKPQHRKHEVEVPEDELELVLEEKDRRKSANHRELMVSRDFYRSKEDGALARKVVNHYTDNKVTFFIVRNGSSHPGFPRPSLADLPGAAG